MSKNDTLVIGPYKYLILERKGNFALLQWTEASGIQKQLWVNIALKVA